MSESKDFWGSSAAFLPALHRDHIIVITGALGFVEVNLRQKALDHLGKLKEHGANVNTSIEALSLVFYPCKIQGNTVTTVEGKETPLFLPRKYSHPEDEAPMEFATAATTIRDALQVLEIERDVTQQRIDELAGEATQVRSVLETETERRRSYRRACFEEIIARNASSRTQSRADVDPSRSSGSSTISSPIVLEASMSTLAFSEPTVPAASDIASADHPPAYSHGS
ncbi:hypothetical protein BKA62DRAFT_283226 [Auriculariales sp. MPI-PUGE-AT-0066]|nr:hypothetical protein BKA62DRAFT_283226 [Auriculariales sp. MPI-PUGE-AT-0066]